MEEHVKEHKPNFVKAPRRVFEKHGGYYSQSDEEKDEDKPEPSGSKAETKPKKEEKDGFRKVTREEWKTMSRKEKKDYLKERKRRKAKEMVYIKDDSDNEQLLSDGSDGEQELELSSSEDEKDKDERLAKEALKSYAQSFTATEHPEDYQLVMRKDCWEKELAEDGQTGPDTLELIELRDKREKVEMKEKEKQDKVRAERLKRMQAFQASSILRSAPEEEENVEEEEEEEEEEDKDAFYKSYQEAIEGDGKVNYRKNNNVTDKYINNGFFHKTAKKVFST